MHQSIKTKIRSNQMLRKHLHLWQDRVRGAAPHMPGIPAVQMLLEKARGQNPSLASLETVKPDSSCLQPLPDLPLESQHTPRRGIPQPGSGVRGSFSSKLVWVRVFGNCSKLLEKNNSQISWGGSQANPPPRGRRWSNESVRSEIKRAWKAFQAA